MSNCLDDNLNHPVFLDNNYLEVFGDNTFESSRYTLITHALDLEEFNCQYKKRRVGRRAYQSALLLSVIFYTYYRDITSSRVNTCSCETGLKFMALVCGTRPHFTTIADFVSRNLKGMTSLFHKVLMICCQSGLVGKERII